MTARFVRGCVLSLVVTSLMTTTALAFELMTFDGTIIKWPTPLQSFDVGIDGSPGAPTPPAGESWDSAFSDALTAWGGLSTFVWEVNESVYRDPCDTGDGLNGVGFEPDVCGDAFGENVLAVASTFFSLPSGNTVQTEIVFNNAISWSLYSGNHQGSPVDFGRVAVHEIGHTSGLGHEADVPAVMHPLVGDLELPQNDDAAGLVVLYGVLCNGPDTDSDGETDNCDEDDDNDGAKDQTELSEATNPLVPDLRVNLSAGTHMLAFPMIPGTRQSPLSSGSLLVQLGADEISRLVDGSIETTLLQNNVISGAFELESRVGYELQLSQPVNLIINGELATDTTVTLSAGAQWSGFIRFSEDLDTAFELLQSTPLTGVLKSVSRIDATTGRYATATVQTNVPVGEDFELRRGEAYVFFVEEGSVELP